MSRKKRRSKPGRPRAPKKVRTRRLPQWVDHAAATVALSVAGRLLGLAVERWLAACLNGG